MRGIRFVICLIMILSAVLLPNYVEKVDAKAAGTKVLHTFEIPKDISWQMYVVNKEKNLVLFNGDDYISYDSSTFREVSRLKNTFDSCEVSYDKMLLLCYRPTEDRTIIKNPAIYSLPNYKLIVDFTEIVSPFVYQDEPHWIFDENGKDIYQYHIANKGNKKVEFTIVHLDLALGKATTLVKEQPEYLIGPDRGAELYDDDRYVHRSTINHAIPIVFNFGYHNSNVILLNPKDGKIVKVISGTYVTYYDPIKAKKMVVSSGNKNSSDGISNVLSTTDYKLLYTISDPDYGGPFIFDEITNEDKSMLILSLFKNSKAAIRSYSIADGKPIGKIVLSSKAWIKPIKGNYIYISDNLMLDNPQRNKWIVNMRTSKTVYIFPKNTQIHPEFGYGSNIIIMSSGKLQVVDYSAFLK
ncbi:hypothetical protein EHS13_08155 [Paenibacillus psychroresistens]|uniref:Uncharacterized protein n=1 Tax=Paenibacillus psychroresistens TaxID=1778678 RepID=A0A6B8RFF6_9BACL|nr:hypothetical protein [Paenibacillus psychroresistens]QGQ94849.1 hypothetical protein EHS13_08155 [Paenibacillus psychroresistens]